jgi:hypothetical protein
LLDSHEDHELPPSIDQDDSRSAGLPCAPPPPSLHREPGARPANHDAKPGAFSVAGLGAGNVAEIREEQDETLDDDDSRPHYDYHTVAYMVSEQEQEQVNPAQEQDRARLKEEIRNQLIREAVQAGSVQIVVIEEGEDDDDLEKQAYDTTPSSRKGCVMVILVGVIFLVTGSIAMAAMFFGAFTTSDGGGDGPSPTNNRTTLEVVRERGYIRCGLFMAAGFCAKNPQTGQLDGLNVDQVSLV